MRSRFSFPAAEYFAVRPGTLANIHAAAVKHFRLLPRYKGVHALSSLDKQDYMV